MGGFLIFYIIFTVLALGTGILFWVRNRYRVLAVIALIFALLAPLLTLLTIAQRRSDIGAYTYLMEQVGSGNTWARITVILHIYLIGWLLFLLVRGIIYLNRSPHVREKAKKLLEQINKLKSKKEKGT